MKKQLKTETIYLMKKMYEESVLDISLIAQVVQVSEQTIRKYAKLENWTRKLIAPKPQKDIEFAIECYKEGIKLNEICDISGVNLNELYEEIDARNIERRTTRFGE